MKKHQHRNKTSAAARLPAKRLPLGSHLPGNKRPASRATTRSTTTTTTTISDSSASRDGGIPLDNLPSSTSSSSASPPPYSDNMSISGQSEGGIGLAEAKLRRQNERIHQAEAAMTAPPPPPADRQRPESRDKGKPSYKKMPIAWDISGAHLEEDSTVQPTERRINTFYPAVSRESSLTRSLSSVSNMTGAFDMDRHDSMMIDTSGFQYPRRGKTIQDQLRAFEDKPEEKQKTVEATPLRREINKVFGIDLPALEFLQSVGPGYASGQLQFVMHPNGDVGAHMWSAERYQWEHIGNFSNIRKRVEGQLGAERLKGETAWQTLQRNSLAYFRAIAKQKEAAAMGRPFGREDILEILGPQPDDLTLSPKTSHRTSIDDTIPRPHDHQSEPAHAVTRRHVPVQPRMFSEHPLMPQRQDYVNDDPFVSTVPRPLAQATPARSNLSAAGSVFQPSSVAYPEHPQASQRPFASVPPRNTIINYASAQHHQLATPQTGLGGHSHPGPRGAPAPYATMAAINQTGASLVDDRRHLAVAGSGTSSCPKPAMPSDTREAMRDQLLKLGSTAQERGSSRTNVRTVLHDPFRAQGGAQHDSEHEQAFEDLWLRQDYALNNTQVSQKQRSTAHPNGELQFKTWANSQKGPFAGRLDSLADSVPDIGYRSSSESRTSSGTQSVLRMEAPVEPAKPKKSYEEELRNWWTSGKKFARQEEFVQSIKALSRTSEPASPSTTRTPRRQLPIGARSGSSAYASPAHTATSSSTATAKPVVPFNESLNRILVPVYESLAGYVEGPIAKRRDYFSNWCKPPEWAIDRDPEGNKSFFDNTWGQPPARVGRDPRYRPIPGEPRFGGYTTGGMPIVSPSVSVASAGIPRFVFPGGTGRSPSMRY